MDMGAQSLADADLLQALWAGNRFCRERHKGVNCAVTGERLWSATLSAKIPERGDRLLNCYTRQPGKTGKSSQLRAGWTDSV
jgi:hypothetical protein